MPIIEVLKKSLWFSSLEEAEISNLAVYANMKKFSQGEYIFWQNDQPEWLYIITEGRVKIIKHSSSGKELIVAFFNPGEMFGEVAVFENKPYPASALAMEETVLLGIKRENFVQFLLANPQVALKIITLLSGRLREAQGRISDLSGERVQQRLARTLLTLSSKFGNTLSFTREEIGDMAGMTTETTIRLMGNLKERGIIQSGRGLITIIDSTKLKLLSEGPPKI